MAQCSLASILPSWGPPGGPARGGATAPAATAAPTLTRSRRSKAPSLLWLGDGFMAIPNPYRAHADALSLKREAPAIDRSSSLAPPVTKQELPLTPHFWV